MAKEEFEIIWETADGYVCGSRSHSFEISADDIEADMSENAIREFFEDMVQNDFEQTVSWSCNQEEEFVQWAKEVAERKKAEEAEG